MTLILRPSRMLTCGGRRFCKRVLAKEVLRQAFIALGLVRRSRRRQCPWRVRRRRRLEPSPYSATGRNPAGTTVAQAVEAGFKTIRPQLLTFVTCCFRIRARACKPAGNSDRLCHESIDWARHGRPNDPRFPQTVAKRAARKHGHSADVRLPTRVRYLFHERPGAAYQWPPDGVIDRELDIAISQFAPSSETVKDGLIHTRVGVVDYQPQGNGVA